MEDTLSTEPISSGFPSNSRNSGRTPPRSRAVKQHPGQSHGRCHDVKRLSNKRSSTISFHRNKSQANRIRSILSTSDSKAIDFTVKPTTCIQMHAARRVFPIYVGNRGVDVLSRSVFRAIQSRDYRVATNISEIQLKYVLTIAYANRIVQTGIAGGYSMDVIAASDLKRAAKAIRLPDVLVKYIQSIGMVDMLNGARVGPFSGGPHQLFPPDNDAQISPASILQEAGRPVPQNPWCIDYEWISAWNQATTRPSCMGMHFNEVEDLDFKGTSRMLVSYRPRVDEMDEASDSIPVLIQGISPQEMSEDDGKLGAVYGFRNYSLQRTWLCGNTSLSFGLFLTQEFVAEQYLSDIVVADFTL